MAIEHKSNRFESARPHERGARNIDREKLRKYCDAIAVSNSSVELNRFAIEQNQIDFGMRYAEAFNRVLD